MYFISTCKQKASKVYEIEGFHGDERLHRRSDDGVQSLGMYLLCTIVRTGHLGRVPSTFSSYSAGLCFKHRPEVLLL